ncbi:shikimate kinase [Microbacter margulisiae]|uniref:Shikimate kinase n=1 Tax=Microbacter margulisiae TaxID=1350067 RepID=A0A7W5DTC4_9PORP|nr:shikimate kinase [Microbacter margulisiae]MBB3188378.1 shikimate kinase [Microbacter margulisiae]
MNPIFLIGYMGSGKSTVGRLLAKHLRLQFIDLDAWIENRYRKSIHDLFAEYGETGFREIEHKNLIEISEFQDVVVATGGGAACYHQNMEWMNAHGFTIYLSASVDMLVDRLKTGKSKRPLISQKSTAEMERFIRESLLQREPYYRQALLLIKSTSEAPEKLAEHIAEEILRFESRS